jgi:hypothetical protein
MMRTHEPFAVCFFRHIRLNMLCIVIDWQIHRITRCNVVVNDRFVTFYSAESSVRIVRLVCLRVLKDHSAELLLPLLLAHEPLSNFFVILILFALYLLESFLKMRAPAIRLIWLHIESHSSVACKFWFRQISFQPLKPRHFLAQLVFVLNLVYQSHISRLLVCLLNLLHVLELRQVKTSIE